MKRTSLELLACPNCRQSLDLQAGLNDPVETGGLVCPACRREYPIRAGIPRFIAAPELSGFNRRFAHLVIGFRGDTGSSPRSLSPTSACGRRPAVARLPTGSSRAAAGCWRSPSVRV